MKPSPELESHLRQFYGALWPMVRDAINSGGAEAVRLTEVSKLLAEHAGADLARIFGRGYDAVAVEPAFNVKPQAAMQFLETYRIKLARSITETLNTKLTTAIRSGLEQGDALPVIRKRLEDEWPAITKEKAEVVARTETARAYGEGNLASWDAQGVKRKEWLLSAAPCALCQDIWSKGPVPISQPFFGLGETLGDVTNDYMDVNAPPAHPACRCAAGAVFEE